MKKKRIMLSPPIVSGSRSTIMIHAHCISKSPTVRVCVQHSVYETHFISSWMPNTMAGSKEQLQSAQCLQACIMKFNWGISLTLNRIDSGGTLEIVEGLLNDIEAFPVACADDDSPWNSHPEDVVDMARSSKLVCKNNSKIVQTKEHEWTQFHLENYLHIRLKWLLGIWWWSRTVHSVVGNN